MKKSLRVICLSICPLIAGCELSLKDVAYSSSAAANLVDPTQSTITATSYTVASGAQLNLTVSLKDTAGSGLSGLSSAITMSLANGGSTATFGTASETATPGVYTITATGDRAGSASDVVLRLNNRMIDGSFPELTVTGGTATSLSIETAADGSGTTIAAQTLAYGDTLTVYSVARDAQGNFSSNPKVNWSVTQGLGVVSSAYATSTVVSAIALGTGAVQAKHSTLGTATSGTLTIGSILVPTSLSGTAAWYDAFRLGYTDTAEISTWPDLSGNGVHATQSTSSSRPTFSTTGLNNQGVANFDGVDDVLTLASTVSVQPATILAVGTQTGTGSPYIGHSTSGLAFGYDNSTAAIFNATALTALSFATALPTGAEIIMVRVPTGGTGAELFVGNTFSLSATATGNDNFTGISINRIGLGNGVFHQGQIGEVIVYSRALTNVELEAAHGYLKTKWGL